MSSKSQGLKQRDRLALTLFNLAGKHHKKTCVNVTSIAINISNQIIGYADDLNVVANTILSVEEPFIEIEDAAKKIGVVISKQETKLLLQSRQQRMKWQQWQATRKFTKN